jgi:hypothetical protein
MGWPLADAADEGGFGSASLFLVTAHGEGQDRCGPGAACKRVAKRAGETPYPGRVPGFFMTAAG